MFDVLAPSGPSQIEHGKGSSKKARKRHRKMEQSTLDPGTHARRVLPAMQTSVGHSAAFLENIYRKFETDIDTKPKTSADKNERVPIPATKMENTEHENYDKRPLFSPTNARFTDPFARASFSHTASVPQASGRAASPATSSVSPKTLPKALGWDEAAGHKDEGVVGAAGVSARRRASEVRILSEFYAVSRRS
jgi:hypothetical protein